MKKIMSLVLATTFILTGCSTTSNISNSPANIPTINIPTVDDNQVEIIQISNYNDMVVEYSTNDVISKMLIDKGHFGIRDNGYALYPNRDYIYPEYLIIDGTLQVVYLKSSLGAKYDNRAAYSTYINNNDGYIEGVFGVSGCSNNSNDNSIACQIAKAIGSGIEFSTADATTSKAAGYIYDVMVAIDGKSYQIWLKARPQVDNFHVDMGTDGGLNVMGIGSGDSNSNSLSDIFGGIINNKPSHVPTAPSAPSVNIPTVNVPPVNNMPVGNNTSEFKEVEESGFIHVLDAPLSTFAADVDTASYTNFRSIMRDFMATEYNYYSMDEMHDIRVEEMLNYFDYEFETGDELFTVNAEVSKTPWNNETELLVLNVKTQELREDNNGSNLVFLIDVSGSMGSEDKLELVKGSLNLLVEELSEKDTISIVTYSGAEEVLIEGANGNDKEAILNAIDTLFASGSTNGEKGLKMAYEIAEKYKDYHSNSRIIMCSDGDLNVGINSETELKEFVSEKRDTGIYLSVLGFGSGNYKDNKMEALADSGNGNYFYIDTLKEGYKVLVEDLMSTLITAADDVKFQIEFNPDYIQSYRKIGYENRNMANADFADDTKDGGEVGYGHSVTVVYEIVPVNPNNDLKYQGHSSSSYADWMTVSIRYKDHGENESNLIEYVVDADNYSEVPSNDWNFISNVVGFALVMNDSQYKEDLTIEEVIISMNDLELNDRDKIEFLSLVIGYRYYLNSYLY